MATEQALIEAARRGESTAREELFHRFETPLRGYLSRKVGARLARAVSISDLCQDTFIGALDAMRVLADGATLDDFQAILYQHANWVVGKHVEKHRAFRGESILGDTPLDVGAAREERSRGEVTRLDELEWLRMLVERLPEEQRAVFQLRLEGRPFAEISAALGIQEDTARQRFLRGSLALRRLAQADGSESP
jgi:RNA polymerase sigma factor (sigma-70 family)